MDDTCQSCGHDFNEWSINEIGLCQNCEMERVGSPLYVESDDIDDDL